MRRAAKVDSNHAEIVKALRIVGVSVLSLAQIGKGCPDLLCSNIVHGSKLLEVKMPGEQLNNEQIEFHRNWRGPIHVVYSVDDALRLFGVWP